MMKIDVEHSEASQLWMRCEQPGHPMQVFARCAVMVYLRKRHPETIERHLVRIDLAIQRLEEAAKHK